MRRILTLLCWLFLVVPAGATVTANSVITTQTPNNGKQNFIQGTDSAGTYKTLYTAGANGSKCTGISASNNDASATHILTFEIVNGGNTYHTVTITTVSPGAGAYSTASVLAAWAGLPSDSDGNSFIFLVSGDVLKATFATALTASDEIDMVATCADF